MTALASGDELPMSTLTALLLTAGRLALLHIGDGRAYLLRGSELSRLTQDHSHVQNLVDAGRVRMGSARDHPDRALLVRVLGAGAGRNDPTSRYVPRVPVTATFSALTGCGSRCHPQRLRTPYPVVRRRGRRPPASAGPAARRTRQCRGRGR